jgi:ferric-chelate reductase
LNELRIAVFLPVSNNTYLIDSKANITTGTAAFVLLLWLNVSSIAPIRNWWYEFFVIQHIVVYMGFVIAMFYHIPNYYVRFVYQNILCQN